MPLPYRNLNEPQNEFVKRCMADEVMLSEFPERNQRYALCNAIGIQDAVYNSQNTQQDLLKDNDMDKDFMKAEPNELSIGDFVRWNSSGGNAYGRITRIVSEGTLAVPETDFILDASEDNPAALIRVYQMDEDGEFDDTDTYVGHRFDTLTRVESLESDSYNNRKEEKAYKGDLMPGDIVTLSLGNGIATGVVEDLMESGMVLDPANGNVYTPKGDDPIALIRLMQIDDISNPKWSSTDKLITRPISSLYKLYIEELLDEETMSMDEEKRLSKSLEKKEFKNFSFEVIDTKQVGDMGIVKGYASTFGNVDRGGDRILAGAFRKSLDRYRKLGRPIKMFYQHDSNEIIGGFPIESIKETEYGLQVEGQINLNVQRGKEAYALAKQGVLTDFSIGYTVDDYEINGGVRDLKSLELWEISMVGEPMNELARITSIKSNEAQMSIKDVWNIKDKKEFEKILRDSGIFSRKAAVYLASFFNEKQSDSVNENKDITELKNLIKQLKNGEL